MVKKLIEQVQSSTDFAQIKADVVICNVFYDGQKTTVGFYDKENHEIYTFSTDEEIKLVDKSKPVHSKQLPTLELNGQENRAANALDTAKKVAKQQYSHEVPVKFFTVLQMTAKGPVWQCVALTKSLNSISVRVDARSGEVVEHSCEQFARMDSK